MNIYINGKIIPATQATIATSDRGLLLGDGIFETIKLIDGTTPLLALHWQRLVTSAQLLQLDLPWDYSTVATGIAQLVSANTGQTTTGVRLTVTRGSGSRSLAPCGNEIPQLIMQLFSAPPPPTQGIKLQVSQIRRNETSPLSGIKSLNYLDNILAQQTALQHGADAALLLNTRGFISGTNFGNIFLIQQQTILTPPLCDGVLPGIMRHCIIETCLQHHIPITQQSLTLEMITPQDSLWMSNALRGIVPITQLDALILNDHSQLRYLVEKQLKHLWGFQSS